MVGTPLSGESFTRGLEVSVFLNDSLLLSLFFEATDDATIQRYHQHATALANLLAPARQATALLNADGEDDERVNEEHQQEIDLMRFVDDCFGKSHSTFERITRPTAMDFQARAMSGTQAFQSLYGKRLVVLRAIVNSAIEDIRTFHEGRTIEDSSLTASEPSRSSPTAVVLATSALVPAPSSSLSLMPPLLRWSLLSMFPLIDAVSRLDPTLRSSTLRILVQILQTSPPLSLMHEDELTITQMQNIMRSDSDDGENDPAIQCARIGLALQRGSLRHILGALLQLITTSNQRATMIAPHIEPYLNALARHQHNSQLASILTDDTFIQAWRHHPTPSAYERAVEASSNVQHSHPASTVDTQRAANLVSLTTPLLASASVSGVTSQRAPARDARDSDDSATPSPIAKSNESATSAAAVANARKIIEVSSSTRMGLPQYGAIATDGKFHYVHSTEGLVKIGSGQHGTLQAHVYACNTAPYHRLAASLTDATLASYLSPCSLNAYGGSLCHARGWLYYRTTRFVSTHSDVLAIRIDPHTLTAHSLVHFDYDASLSSSVNADKNVWLQLSSDGERIYLLREVDRISRMFAVDTLDPPRYPTAPLTLPIQSSASLPTGWTQFPAARRFERSLSSLQSPIHFYVGQKVDAKDSVNKWCPAEIVEVSPSSVLVHYEGWAKRWDEWLQIDSGRIVRRGAAHPDKDTAHNTGKDSASESRKKPKPSSMDVDDVDWAYSKHSVADALRTTEDVEWIPHTSINSNRLEQAYQAMLALAQSHSLDAAVCDSASTVLLRGQRQSWTVALNTFTQMDNGGAVYRLRRKAAIDQASQAVVEDLQLMSTGEQLIVVMPAHCGPNFAKKPVARVFARSTSGQAQLTHVVDSMVLLSSPTNAPPQLTAASLPSLHASTEIPLFSLCYDRLNDELISYHLRESLIRQWRNTGPMPSSTRAIADTNSLVEPSSSLLPTVARLLALVSQSSRHQRFHSSARALGQSALLQPFCIDVHEETFRAIRAFLTPCIQQLKHNDTAGGLLLAYSSIVSSLLRLLEANLGRLDLLSSLPTEIRDSLAQLRHSLTDITALASTSAVPAIRALQPEAIACLIASFEFFYPQATDIQSLVMERLSEPTPRDELIDHLSSSQSLIMLINANTSDCLSATFALLLRACESEAMQLIGAVTAEMPLVEEEDEPVSKAPPPIILSSALQLMLILQRYLFAASLMQSDDSETWREVLDDYFTQLLKYCVSVISEARHSLLSNPASGAKILAVLQSTLTGVLVPSALVLAPTLVTNLQRAPAIVESLLSLVRSVDDLNQLACIGHCARVIAAPRPALPSTDPDSRQYLTGMPPMEFVHTECESSHPYSPSTVDTTLALPGAIFLACEFDSRCSTRNSNDCVKLSQDRWSLQCSGLGGSDRIGSRWPSSFVRRTGDRLALFWQFEQDDKANKDRTAVPAKDEWGFACTLHGFKPHPLPRIKYTGPAAQRDVTMPVTCYTGVGLRDSHGTERLPWTLDFHLTIMVSIGIAVRTGMQNRVHWLRYDFADTVPARLSIPLAVIHHLHFNTDSAAAEEDESESALEPRLDLSILSSQPLSLTEDIRSMIYEMVGGSQPLIGPLSFPSFARPSPSAGADRSPIVARSPSPSLTLPSLALCSLSPPGTPSISPEQLQSPLVIALIDILAANIGGRMPMNASMKRVMAPIESAVLAALLVHFNLADSAHQLAQSLMVPSESFSLTAPLPSSASALTASPISTASKRRPPKRTLTAEQSVWLDSIKPLWSSVCRLESWIIQQVQARTKYQEIIRELRAALEGQPSSEIEVRCRTALSELSGDVLKHFCQAKNLTHQPEREVNIAHLANAATRDITTNQPIDSASQSQTSHLESLVARVWEMAQLFASFQPPVELRLEPTPAVISPLMDFFTEAALGSVTAPLIQAIRATRISRIQSRAASLQLASSALMASTHPTAHSALLESLKYTNFESHIVGVPVEYEKELQDAGQSFFTALCQIVDKEQYTDLELFTDSTFAHHLQCYAGINATVQPMGQWMKPIVQSLLSTAQRLTDTARLAPELQTPLLPAPLATLLGPPRSTPLSAVEPSLSTVCCFAYSGGNHVSMQCFMCRTCGFDEHNQRVICRSCALTCHREHEVVESKTSASTETGSAFCDCFLYNGESCLGMQPTRPSRQRRALLKLSTECLETAILTAHQCAERLDEESRKQVLTLLIEAIHQQAQQLAATHRVIDDEILHALLQISFHLNCPSLENAALIEQYLVDLITIFCLGSTRCQRYAQELLHDFVSMKSPAWFDDMPRLLLTIDKHLPSSLGLLRSKPDEQRQLFQQAHSNDSDSECAMDSVSSSLVAGFLSAIGLAVLGECMLESEVIPDSRHPKTVTQSVDKHLHDQQRSNKVYQLVLIRPVNESDAAPGSKDSDSSSSRSPSSFANYFLEKCVDDLLRYQYLQSVADNDPSAIDPTSLTNVQKQLTRGYRSAVLSAFDGGSEAVVFQGCESYCCELGMRLAQRGLVTLVQSLSPSAARVRNVVLSHGAESWHGWCSTPNSGRQRLENASALIHLVRSMITSKDSAWTELITQNVSAHLTLLTGDVVELITSSRSSAHFVAASLSLTVMGAIGALCVVAGSTGYNLPALGMTANVNTREASDDQPSVMKPEDTPNASVADIARTLCAPHRRGIVIGVNEGGSGIKVVFHDDPRACPEKVHMQRVTSVPARSAQDDAVIAAIRHELPQFTTKIMNAFVDVHEASSRTSLWASSAPSPWSRWLLSWLSTRLIRAMMLVSNEDAAMKLLLSNSVAVRALIDTAIKPCGIAEQRSLGHEWSRGMASLIDMSDGSDIDDGHRPWTKRALHYQLTESALSPNTFDARSVSHCVFSDGELAVKFVDNERSDTRVRKVKIDIDSLLPVLVTAKRPLHIIEDSQRLYFEVTVVGEAAGVSVGLAPRQLPLDCLTNGHANSSESTSYFDSSVGSRHLFGWPEGSVVYLSDGCKARYWHATKNVASAFLHQHDLCDVKDSVGKFAKAIVIGETEAKVLVHYLAWDERYDEWIPRDSERIQTFHVRSFNTKSTVSSTVSGRERVTGQLWREPYGRPIGSGATVGCGYDPCSRGVYFTLNGSFMGVAYSANIASCLFPAVCLGKAGAQVRGNFDGPFLYDFRHERSESSTQTPSTLALPGDGLTSMWTSLAQVAWHTRARTDISCSLSGFNDGSDNDSDSVSPLSHQTESNAMAVIHRLVSFAPTAPTPAVFERHQRAMELMATQALPDLTLSTVMRVLARHSNDIERAVDDIYDQELLPSNRVADSESATPFLPAVSSSSSSTVFAPAGRATIFPSSSSSFYSSPFNTSPARPERERPERLFGGVPPRPRIHSSPASDIFDDLSVDFEQEQSEAEISAQSLLGADHAYSFHALHAPQSSNDYEVSESAEIASHALDSRNERRAFDGDAENFGGSVQSLLEDLFSRGNGSGSDVLRVFAQLRQLQQLGSLESATLTFLGRADGLANPAPVNGDEDDVPSLFLLTSQPSRSRPCDAPPIRRSDWRVGVTVRISKRAKSKCVSPIPGRCVDEDVPWSESMDDTIGRVGIIRAVDTQHGLIAVEIYDNERSRSLCYWFPPAVLTKLIAMRSNAYIACSHRQTIFAHLRHIQYKMAKGSAKLLLMSWIPKLTSIAKQSLVAVHSKQEPSPAPSLHTQLAPLLLKDSLLAWSSRAFQAFVQFDLSPALTSPPLPYSEDITKSSPLSSAPVTSRAMLDYMIDMQPNYVLQCLQHTIDMLVNQSQIIDFTVPALNVKTVLSMKAPSLSLASSAQRSLLYRCIHVPQACALAITFLSPLSLPAGTSLSFFTAPHLTRPSYQFQGQQTTGSRATGVALPPIILNTNIVWILLSADLSLLSSKESEAVSASLVLLVTPVSEQLGAALALGHSLVDRHAQSPSASSTHLCLTFDKSVEILTSHQARVPATIRLSLLRLITRITRTASRGVLGDIHSALPLFRELSTIYREQRESHTARTARHSRSGGEYIEPVFTPTFQRLVEYHTALIEHFQQPSPSALAPTSDTAPPESDLAVIMGESEESKAKETADSELLSIQSAVRTFVRHEQQRQQQRDELLALLSSPPQSLTSDEVNLHHDYRWPEWFLEVFSLVSSMRAVVSGGYWTLTLNSRRKSGLSVMLDDYEDMASRFDPLMEEAITDRQYLDHPSQGRNVQRQCLSLVFYEQLAQCIDHCSETLGLASVSVRRSELMNDSQFVMAVRAYPLLSSLSSSALLHHATFLQTFNLLLQQHLSCFDLSCTGDSDSLASLIQQCRGLIFHSLKKTFLYFILNETATPNNSGSNPGIRINRLLAARSWDKEFFAKDYEDRAIDRIGLASETIVGQSFTQLRGINAINFRKQRPRGGAPHTAFVVQFEGEQVLGQGGPWRQFFTDVCKELQSTVDPKLPSPLPLLMPTPNHQHSIGEDRHLFMANPSATSVPCLELFEHVGRLMGIACRTKVLLSLDLPLAFWKQLIGEKPQLQDLEQIDAPFIHSVVEPALQCQSEEQFNELFNQSLTWPITKSDGELVFDRAPQSPVTYQSLSRYIQQLIEARLSESRQQIDAIRRGLSDLIPLSLLTLLTPKECEQLFCGSPSIDVELLKRHTEYSGGLSADTPHIQHFWQVLSEFDDNDRRRFIQFAYAQSRLPSDDAGFSSFPKIRMLVKPSRIQTGDIDAAFPHSDTCFFNLELPAYSSLEMMRTRLKQVCEMAEWGLSGDEMIPQLPAAAPPRPGGASSIGASTAARSPAVSPLEAPRGSSLELRTLHTPATVPSTSQATTIAPHSNATPASTGFSSLLPESDRSRAERVQRDAALSALMSSLSAAPSPPAHGPSSRASQATATPPRHISLARPTPSNTATTQSPATSLSTSSINSSATTSVSSPTGSSSLTASIGSAFASSFTRLFTRRTSTSTPAAPVQQPANSIFFSERRVDGSNNEVNDDTATNSEEQ